MKRDRVVLDTNVLISAVLFNGPPRAILDLVIGGSLYCSLSLAILDELRDVLERPKFRFSPEQAFQVIEELHAVCDIVNPAIRVNVVTADPNDNIILECALESKADIIVSGDQHLLAVIEFRGIRIVSPADYLKLINEHMTVPTRKSTVRLRLP
jgi:putative PIN family toxin of toxin-antitoxin system